MCPKQCPFDNASFYWLSLFPLSPPWDYFLTKYLQRSFRLYFLENRG